MNDVQIDSLLIFQRYYHAQCALSIILALIFHLCSCYFLFLKYVNKQNRPGKATTSPGNTALSNEIFAQKSIVLFNFRSVAFIFYFTRWKRERK